MTTPLKSEIRGAITALITPFKNQEVDYASLEKLVHYQLDHGIQGFVINGTTAESPTLTWPEVQKIYSVVRAIVGLKFPLILGTGTNSTTTTIELTKKASELGADAALVVVPYYNKPPQRGLVEHFKLTARASDIPIILYNVPGRTITSLSQESIFELSETKNIIGLKEASGDLSFDEALTNKLKKNFIMLSGDDPTYIDFLRLGGHGIISVMSNLLTEQTARWTKQVLSGEVQQAKDDFKKYSPLIQMMYCEANPIAIKWMLYKADLIASPELRLPLSTLDTKFHSEILQELEKLQIIKK